MHHTAQNAYHVCLVGTLDLINAITLATVHEGAPCQIQRLDS
jgi:hypothetical protein